MLLVEIKTRKVTGTLIGDIPIIPHFKQVYYKLSLPVEVQTTETIGISLGYPLIISQFTYGYSNI